MHFNFAGKQHGRAFGSSLKPRSILVYRGLKDINFCPWTIVHFLETGFFQLANRTAPTPQARGDSLL